MAETEQSRAAALEGVRKRTAVDKLVEEGDRSALSLARSIRHPWYRCQALTRVAGSKDRNEALRLLEEAFAAASEQNEINRIVVVSSWPLRELVPRDLAPAAAHLKRLVALAAGEPHGLRRANALYAVCAATYPAAELRPIVVGPLVTTLLAGHGWRIERLMHGTAILIQVEYSDLVRQLLAAHPANRRKRKLESELGRRADA